MTPSRFYLVFWRVNVDNQSYADVNTGQWTSTWIFCHVQFNFHFENSCVRRRKCILYTLIDMRDNRQPNCTVNRQRPVIADFPIARCTQFVFGWLWGSGLTFIACSFLFLISCHETNIDLLPACLPASLCKCEHCNRKTNNNSTAKQCTIQTTMK